MVRTRLIGDLHTHDSLKSLMSPNSIQLGDLDVFSYDKWTFDSPRFFIDGNHDHFPSLNPNGNKIQEINTNLFYIPRGYVNGKVMFIGGAFSIDYKQRTIGYDLFNEETLNLLQYNKIMNVDKEIEVIIAHDFPYFMYQRRIKELWGNMQHSKVLEEIFNKFKPKMWINGHHHIFQDDLVNGCRFVTVPQYNYIEIDLPLERTLSEDIL